MERKELKASYELAKTYEGLRREKLADMYKRQKGSVKVRRFTHTADELLNEYDRQYLLLALFVFDPQAAEEADCPTENENSRDWWKLGYKRALVDMFSIFVYDEGNIVDRYNALAAEFEKEINNEKAQED